MELARYHGLRAAVNPVGLEGAETEPGFTVSFMLTRRLDRRTETLQ